jgi:DNA-binding MarR family transcriptional regulator
MHHRLEKYGIGSGQFHFLIMIYKKEGTNQETLAEELKMDKATCTRAIQKLEELGYIYRKRNPNDKRCYTLHLTQKAIDLKPIAMDILKEWTTLLLTGFTEGEKEQLFIFLDRLSKNSTNNEQIKE